MKTNGEVCFFLPVMSKVCVVGAEWSAEEFCRM